MHVRSVYLLYQLRNQYSLAPENTVCLLRGALLESFWNIKEITLHSCFEARCMSTPDMEYTPQSTSHVEGRCNKLEQGKIPHPSCYSFVYVRGAQPSQTSSSSPQQYLSATLPLNCLLDCLQRRPRPREGNPTAKRCVSSLGIALNQNGVPYSHKTRRRTPAVGPNVVYTIGEMCVA